MLSFKKLFCVSLLHYFVCANIIKTTTSPPEPVPVPIPTTTPPSTKCDPGKSLHSRNDIKVMIDFIYNETSLGKTIKQNYQSAAEAIRDKHLQDLNDFTTWFENQPEHLKAILRSLEMFRSVLGPAVESASQVLAEYPKFEMSYNKKNESANRLFKKFAKYSMICKLNCEDQQVTEHEIIKRQVQDDFYCSSLEDLHKEISEKLNGSLEEINNDLLRFLSMADNEYKEKIDEIKSELKDSALKEFGRTMYDILNLEYEYRYFMDNIAATDLHEATFEIKSLGLQVDAKLLQLDQAIEKFGHHCNSCGSKNLLRSVRNADYEFEPHKESLNLIDILIEIKLEEIEDEIENDWNEIFDHLNTLIHNIGTENNSIEKLRPIQDEISNITISEKEALDKLKDIASLPSIKQILELIKKLKELIQFIVDILHNLHNYTNNSI